jgi:hypothetical protein
MTMSMRTIGRRAAETREHAQQTGTELKRSTREAGRTLRSAVETVRAAMNDGIYAMIGVGDVAASAVRTLRRKAVQLPADVLHVVRSTPRDVRDGLEQLRQRGQTVAARMGRSQPVRDAMARTRIARKSTHQAVVRVRGAARAQVRGVKRAASSLGRSANR